MSRSNRTCLLAVLSVCASTIFTVAQAAPQTGTLSPSNSAPVALVYVSSNPSSSDYLIQAYTAAANGSLVATVGQNFSQPLSYLTASSHFLFATDGVNLDSFSVAQNDGAFTEVDSVNAQALGGGCGGPINVFLDRTGSTLYDLDFLGSQCANNAYQEFSVTSTGTLDYMGAPVASPGFETPLSFLGNNQYGYSATCYHFDPVVFGYERASDGSLTELSIVPAMPLGASGQEYCPSLGATDSANHLAVVMSPIYDSNWQPAGPNQLGVYTADASGNLTTTSRHSNMPAVVAGSVNQIVISPSGKLLAVAGSAGLQVFHFNGANPITRYTGLLAKDPIAQIFWDNSNHLYAVSPSAGKLYVFTVTSASAVAAPGSPYLIKNPLGLAVLSEK